MCSSPKQQPEKMPPCSRFTLIILFLISVTMIYIVISFQPMSLEQHHQDYEKMNKHVEHFRKNISECAHQVKASMADVDNFLKRIPMNTMQGKCLVACILKRNAIITNNKINANNLLEINAAVFGTDNEIMSRLETAVNECSTIVDNIFEICEYAAIFNDCMHMKMEHSLDKKLMERRMETLGQMTSDPEEWTEEEDELLKLAKDEL